MFKRILLNKKGLGMSTVLGVLVFTTAVAVTVFSVVNNQFRNVTREIYNSDEYKQAVIAVNATARLFKNRTDINASTFSSIVTEIDNYVAASSWGQGIEIVTGSNYVVTINHSVAGGLRTVTSYLSPSNLTDGGLPVTVEEQQDIMSYMPLIEPVTEEEFGAVADDLASSYLDYYLSEFTNTNPDTVSTGTESIATVVENIITNAATDSSFLQYAPFITTISYKVNKTDYTHITYQTTSNTTLSSTQPQYVNGNLNVSSGVTLTIPKGQTLFVNGNLVLDASTVVYGNFFVKGNVVVRGNNAVMQTTIYQGGFFYSNNNLVLGSHERPAFIFSNDVVQLSNMSDEGVVYIFAKEFIYTGGNPDLSGDVHVYSYDTKSIDFTDDAEMEPYNLMQIYEDFLDYGFPVLVGGSGFDNTPAS